MSLRFLHLVIFLFTKQLRDLFISAKTGTFVQDEYRQQLKAREDQVEDAEARLRNVEWLLQEKVEELREQVSAASCPSSMDSPLCGPGSLCPQNLRSTVGIIQNYGQKVHIFSLN